jgi:signal transduction histidine kinase
MDYRKAGAAHYRYRLKGFDYDWNNSGLSNTATYTNLDPGNYTFLVQASNDNTTWSNDFALLNLHVLPMWWQTWSFKIFVGCCIVAIGYTIYHYRLQQLLKIERVRNNIARDLHDEIGSSLSSISIFSRLAQRHINTKDVNPDLLLQKINEDAIHVMDSMSDIVWSINTKNDEFENVFYRMREHAVQLLEAKNYVVHFHFDERLGHIRFDMQNRRDFYLIYKEALNNIAKYAEGKNVWIDLALNNNKIELVIKDDGKGFDVSKANRKGNGLSNMHKRADAISAKLDITSTINGGSALHLSFHRR